MKPFLLEWLEMLIDNSPQHPILRRIRSKESLGENEQDRFLCRMLECNRECLFDFFRTTDLQEYISFILGVSIEDISEIRIKSNVYTSDDFEGAFKELNKLINQFVTEEYPIQRTIRAKAHELSETISKKLTAKVRESHPSSREQTIRQELGQARTDTEELIKYIDCFLSRLGLSEEPYKASQREPSREKLFAVVSRITKISSHSIGLHEINGDAPRELARLIDCLSEKIEESQVNELKDMHPDFEDPKFIEEPYCLHALRIFGNIFHHEGANYSHMELIQKYADIAGGYLRRLANLIPGTVYIEGIEHMFSGKKVIKVYDTETRQMHSFAYTQNLLIERYKPITDKTSSENDSFRKRLVEAFILPGNLSEQRVAFPYIVEWKIVPLGRSYIDQLAKQTPQRIEITLKTHPDSVIKSEQNVQDQ